MNTPRLLPPSVFHGCRFTDATSNAGGDCPNAAKAASNNASRCIIVSLNLPHHIDRTALVGGDPAKTRNPEIYYVNTLKLSVKLLRSIDARREATGDQGIGSVVERDILDANWPSWRSNG
jgi:hypothetical protein